MISLAICSTHDYSPVGSNMQLKLSSTTVARIIKRSSVSAMNRRIGLNKRQLHLQRLILVVRPLEIRSARLKMTVSVGISRSWRLNAVKKEMQLFCFAGLTKLVASSMIAIERIAGGLIISVSMLMISLAICSTHISQFLSCILRWRASKIGSKRERQCLENKLTQKSPNPK